MAHFTIRPTSIGPDMTVEYHGYLLRDSANDQLLEAAKAFAKNIGLIITNTEFVGDANQPAMKFTIGTDRSFHIWSPVE